jgi:hypothetical protein
MPNDSLMPPPLERLLTALLALPPSPEQASPHDASDSTALLLLELMDMALHTPPAEPLRMAMVQYFCKHARHRLGLVSWRDLQALLEQYPQSDEGDAEVARLLWGVEAQEHVRALHLLVWFMAAYDVTELGQWHAWMDTVGFEEALRESLETLGAGAVVLLWQAKSGRTDHAWVLRFARRALGHSVSEGPAMLAFRDAAEAMGVPQRVLARQVAHWERAAMGVDDASGLRVLWWQCVAEALQVHVAQETSTAASSDEWRVELSPALALRYSEAGVVLEPQARELQAHAPVVTALRLRQRSWAQGLGLWLEIQGEGRLSAMHQMAIAERFEAAGHRSPQLRYASANGGHQATWLATWHWDEAVWVPKDMPVADVKRWALETALKATEHWLLMCGMVALAGKPQGAALALDTGLVGVDVTSEASNEKKF